MSGYRRKRADSLKKPFTEEYEGIQLKIDDSDRIIGFQVQFGTSRDLTPDLPHKPRYFPETKHQTTLSPVHQQKAL
jgi:hypothetical protein